MAEPARPTESVGPHAEGRTGTERGAALTRAAPPSAGGLAGVWRGTPAWPAGVWADLALLDCVHVLRCLAGHFRVARGAGLGWPGLLACVHALGLLAGHPRGSAAGCGWPGCWAVGASGVSGGAGSPLGPQRASAHLAAGLGTCWGRLTVHYRPAHSGIRLTWPLGCTPNGGVRRGAPARPATASADLARPGCAAGRWAPGGPLPAWREPASAGRDRPVPPVPTTSGAGPAGRTTLDRLV
ncbi:hypothetical protein QFZ55_001027 [Streptomyces luteogriseus]|nr:hypothetical protein [Streptomyces luteogriseus]